MAQILAGWSDLKWRVGLSSGATHTPVAVGSVWALML